MEVGMTHRWIPVVFAIVAGTTLATAGRANASTDDSFPVVTGATCPTGGFAGVAQFVDYGPGVPGNGANNDDYISIRDLCGDGYGVKVYAWINGNYLGARYDGNTATGDPVIWDPFPSGNVKGGDYIGLKVCLADGAEGTAFGCDSVSRYSDDG
jgi:hypothetical protein